MPQKNLPTNVKFRTAFLPLSRKIKLKAVYALWHEMVLGAMLIGGFFIRLHFLIYPLVLSDDGDSSRDYLIARHIVVFHEFPLLGPWNGALQGFINSPFYYYLLALFVRIKDDLVFASAMDLLLQLFSGVLVYEIAKRLSGKPAGLMAAALFLFSDISIVQSRAFWQPYSMLPFFFGMVLCLVIAWQKKNNRYLLAAMVLFVLAGALHNSVFSEFPALVIAVPYIFYKNKGTLTDACLFGLVVLNTVLALFMSVFIASQRAIVPIIRFTSTHIGKAATFSHNFHTSVNMITNNYLGYGNQWLLVHSICGWFFLLCLAIYILKRKTRQTKIGMSFLVALFLLPIILLSVFGFIPRDLYFTLDFGLGFIIIACIVNEALGQRLGGTILKYLFAGALIYIFSGQLFSQRQYIGLPATANMSREITASIASSAEEIKKSEGYDGYGFFTIAAYEVDNGSSGPVGNIQSAIFWAPLEKYLDLKLVKLDTNASYGLGYKALGTNQYVFAACRAMSLSILDDDSCTKAFELENHGYVFVRQVYASPYFTVDLMKK